MPQFAISAPFKFPFGTIQIQKCVKGVSELPEQLIGLVPCRVLQNPCDPRPYINTCVIALAEVAFTCDFKNDFNSFLFEFATTSGNDFRLQKKQPNGTFLNIATLNNNTYGQFFNFGAFASYPTYSGYKIEWQKVLAAFGVGIYRFIVNNTTPADILYSYDFALGIFSEDAAHQTIRLSTTFNGRTSNRLWQPDNARLKFFDLVDMTWADQCRYSGFFGNIEPASETTFVNDSNDNQNKVFTKHKDLFTIEINRLTEEQLWRVEHYGFDSPTIWIEDYNKENPYHFNERFYIVKPTPAESQTFPKSRFHFVYKGKCERAYELYTQRF